MIDMKHILTSIFMLMAFAALQAASPYDNADTLVVARDGTGQFRTVDEAIEVCRAFMDYHKVIFVKKGVYKEKLVIPSWLQNIEICGEDRDLTVITYDDHANIRTPERPNGMGTFRTYTIKVEGNDITFKNITIENNSARLGQAVALHTEGDRLTFINCRFLGHQDTIYTGVAGTRLSSRTATSRVLPTLSSVHRRRGLRIATFFARPTATSPLPPRLRKSPMDTYLTTAPSAVHPM